MQICQRCGSLFPFTVLVDGLRLNVHGRKTCLECRPHHPQRKPRKRVQHPIRLKTCEACGEPFPARQIIDGKLRYLYSRRFCFKCSPFGLHNTSKSPNGIASLEELREHRRRHKNAATYRSQKKRRTRRKMELVEARGGRCEDCGYKGSLAALEFHHRDPATKDFGLGNFSGNLSRLRDEASKCDLLCASCHRLRHAPIDGDPAKDPVVRRRRARKLRAVMYMGGACFACGGDGAPSLFEFHHWDAKEKDFGISEDGIERSWEKIVAELAKCVMLCANCHREVHAGARELDEGLLGLAEPPGLYAA